MSMEFFESEIALKGHIVVLPLRCTIVKLTNATVMISPIDFSPAQLKRIEAIGPITDIVAPSLIHHVYLKTAIERFKPRNVWGAPGAKEKLPEISFTKIFTRDLWPYESELETVFIAGIPKLNEMAFFEKESRTMIVSDFVFNIMHPKGWFAPVALRMLGTWKRFAISKIISSTLKDRSALESSLVKMLAWKFDRLVMAHGDIVDVDARKKFDNAIRERGLIEMGTT